MHLYLWLLLAKWRGIFCLVEHDLAFEIFRLFSLYIKHLRHSIIIETNPLAENLFLEFLNGCDIAIASSHGNYLGSALTYLFDLVVELIANQKITHGRKVKIKNLAFVCDVFSSLLFKRERSNVLSGILSKYDIKNYVLYAD